MWRAGRLWSAVLFWLVPLVTTHAYIGSVMELIEHTGLLGAGPEAGQKSRNWKVETKGAPFFSPWRLIGVHFDGYHLVHHLFPKVPSWAYHAVHEKLLDIDPAYRAFHLKEQTKAKDREAWPEGLAWPVLALVFLCPALDAALTQMFADVKDREDARAAEKAQTHDADPSMD